MTQTTKQKSAEARRDTRPPTEAAGSKIATHATHATHAAHAAHAAHTTRRSWLVPEVLQSSLMDCGPAALKAVLDGFGIDASYDALRERCQTDVDGTSIDALAALGREYGLRCEQVLVPHDHLPMPESDSLPAIVITRSGAGSLHFVVAWRHVAGWVQLMDPGSGRSWRRVERVLGELPYFALPVSAARWRRWAASTRAQTTWRAALGRLGLSARRAHSLLDAALADPTWKGLAELDAATRMAGALVASGAARRGAGAWQCLQVLLSDRAPLEIPPRFRWIRASSDSPERLEAHGAVILRFSRPPAGLARRPVVGATMLPGAAARPGAAALPSAEAVPGATTPPSATTMPPATDRSPESHPTPLAPAPAAAMEAAIGAATEAAMPAALPQRVKAELARPHWRPLAVLWALARDQAGGTAAGILLGALASSALIPVEALLLTGLLEMGEHRSLSYEQLVWMLAIAVLVGVGLWIDAWLGRATVSLGRALELRLRAASLARLPRLEENYLRSRPASDMANRAHGLHGLRRLPSLWAQIAREAGAVVALVAALAWLYPGGWRELGALAGAALLLPLLGRARATEKSARLATHAATLDRLALDALLGATALSAHGAAPAIENAHEEMLSEWATTAREVDRHHTLARALQLGGTTAVATALLITYWSGGGALAGLLPLAFLALRVPAAGASLTAALFAVRELKTLALRTLAPLAAATAPTTPAVATTPAAASPAPPPSHGLHLTLQDVTVNAGGHPLLRRVNLEIEPGAHVAIVGESGAGKSSLIGLLLGFLQPSEGTLRVDGVPLDAAGVRALREQIAWVDPAVQLWDRSLLDNLGYGDDTQLEAKLAGALEAAELLDVVPRLPAGLQTTLGENGGRVSGGQGQRIRLGRALLRASPRLVLLDEPFRGLPREQRRALLGRLHEAWRGSTLLFVSHDVDDTAELERVVVLDRGRVVEEGRPRELLASGGRYATLHQSARALGDDVWHDGTFERRRLERGQLRSEGAHGT